MSDVKQIPLSKPSIGQEELDAIKNVCESGCLAGTCEETKLFEKEFAAFVGAKYAVATSNCTTALHLACLALGVGKKSKVVVPAYTFPATANAPMYCGASPEIVDVHPDTWNLDVSKIRTRKPDVLMPVHCFGNPADMVEIYDYSVEREAYIIEDAACAMPAYIHNKHAGTFGTVGCYSFYAIKNLCTGEGGMLVTDEEEIAELAHSLCDFGKTTSKPLPRFTRLGYNYRLSSLQAAMGRVQLRKMPELHKKRLAIAALYDKFVESELSGKVSSQRVLPGHVSAYQRYALRLGFEYDRDTVLSELAKRGIGCTIGTFDLSSQPLYLNNCNGISVSKEVFYQSISLPMYPDLSIDDAQRVMDALAEVLKR
ncbi:MAG: DegT/DnrJ/EryC1/StrS aminotransferase family protein [Candidatus Methanoperedens sp.]|nr:DegT/DnrJ/EryC1/StrS aminotransferase family protein [Candidatus Methanoperedens sp.]